jgi:hypothetical protein
MRPARSQNVGSGGNTPNTDVSISVILVNAIIFSVISLLREDPFAGSR